MEKTTTAKPRAGYNFRAIISISSLFTLFCLLCTSGFSQEQTASTTGGVYVDREGLMRWEVNDAEVKGFGVNYTVPFAHAYRSAENLGLNPLEQIDQDIYHFSRLGFDLFRVHVWDTEISDTLGNLLFNEHLHAFDYLLHKLAERNINYVITPIAFWGNGWPEPDKPSPGFSAKYEKGDCLTNPEAIKAQEKYLFQFLNHINPYTGIAYKNDPRLIAVEVSNEPHHREAPEKVQAFIEKMVRAIKKTGFKKPIFYNISHSVHLVDTYFKSGIQGGTFQWYPTGLGYQAELPGNILPRVDDYKIPFDRQIKKYKGAKLVYEFDAADVGRAYVYPAMARSFRTAGIQIATHFAYDPMFLAYANTEYNTHYMNLAYTPQKALALMISSEVFHKIPVYEEYGSYPDNTTFGDFRVSHTENLALFNDSEKYYYTNTTETAPKNLGTIQHIAGYANSPIVSYDGTGAYFLDKLAPGIWRLEVMPDAQIVRNPYGRNSLKKEVAVIQWNQRNMQINLKELGDDFSLMPINQENDFHSEASERNFVISPGVYLVLQKGKSYSLDKSSKELGEFYAPKDAIAQTYFLHEPPQTVFEGADLQIKVKVVSPEPIEKVQIMSMGNVIDMKWKRGFEYEASIPSDKVKRGFLSYYIIVKGKETTHTFPAQKKGMPFEWDFYDRNPYRVRVTQKEQNLYLFQAQEDASKLSFTRWTNFYLRPLDHPHESEYQIRVDKLHQVDSENLNGPIIPDYSLRHYLNRKLGPVQANLSHKKTLVLKARSLSPATTAIQLALINEQGFAYGKIIELSSELEEYEISLSDLQKVKTVNLPRPYPTFLPYYFEADHVGEFNIQEIEAIQISLGPGLSKENLTEKQGVTIVSISLK